MISNMTQKEKLLDLLLVSQERGGRAYSRLLRHRMPAEAAAVRQRNRALMRSIERLWVQIANTWNGTASTKTRELKRLNANIKRSTTGLRDRVSRAQRSAKIVSLLDDVIALATGL